VVPQLTQSNSHADPTTRTLVFNPDDCKLLSELLISSNSVVDIPLSLSVLASSQRRTKKRDSSDSLDGLNVSFNCLIKEVADTACAPASCKIVWASAFLGVSPPFFQEPHRHIYAPCNGSSSNDGQGEHSRSFSLAAYRATPNRAVVLHKFCMLQFSFTIQRSAFDGSVRIQRFPLGSWISFFSKLRLIHSGVTIAMPERAARIDLRVRHWEEQASCCDDGIVMQSDVIPG